MIKGLIIKGVAGRYIVETGDSSICCNVRGRLRLENFVPMTGDQVELTVQPDGSGRIERICPRKNECGRPMVANIDLIVAIISAAPPSTPPGLIDRILADSEYRGVETLVCVNKCDLDSGKEIAEIYAKAGYEVIHTSAKTGYGLSELSYSLKDKISAFSGNSGVGKSSLINALIPGLALSVGNISEKVGRGKHTTRHVELIHIPSGGLIADTPGFSVFDPAPIPAPELQYCFREFGGFLDGCRYTGCAHVGEQGCAVLDGVNRGVIPEQRYQSYLAMHAEAKLRDKHRRR